MAATGIGYFSIPETSPESFVRWDLLEQLPARYADDHLRHVTARKPFAVYMDALNHRGIIIQGKK